ncbi:D-2-hydroxyacid dehydrogenase [Halalkalirubrum salinum]|uniref:D-2-hydroxyacid dehydrogenase n=1 Tax=Halalkalirubrum salinum TaxID=2563889 RepID=UPI0010FB5D66|nr:D-2-hydroxyacid dehydrogenase [Halalkalirubrum salinum]
MELDRVAIHESVSIVFDPENLQAELSELPVTVETVQDGELFDRTDAVVAFGPGENFLDAGWVHCIRAGYDEFDIDTYERDGVILTNSTGIHGTSVGETVTGYLLAFARRLHRYRDRQARRTWEREPKDVPFTLAGETICVVGLGTLGQGIAARANGLKMNVVGVRRSGAETPGVEAVFTPDQLESAVEDARFVAIATPLTDETEGMIDGSVFEAMREDAYLINVARGPVVDESALIAAIEREAIAGAGLDVFETEPLAETSPLWDFENVIITPHVAAMTNTYHEDIAAVVRENVDRLERGEPWYNRVV